jgi:hypothetical protein
MTTTFTRTSVPTRTTLIGGTSAGLRNLANNTCRLGPAVSPTAGGPELISEPQLQAKYQGNPVSGIVVGYAWLLAAKWDGSSWVHPTIGAACDGSATVFPPWAPDFQFFWDVGTAHAGAPDILQAVPREVWRPAGQFKVLYRNVSGQAHTNANDTDSLLYESVLSELGT